VALRDPEAVQWLQDSAAADESRPSRIDPINLGTKQTGERSAGNTHSAFDVAGTGNVARLESIGPVHPMPQSTTRVHWLSRAQSDNPHRADLPAPRSGPVSDLRLDRQTRQPMAARQSQPIVQ
jgi:hypothetical protein